MATNWCRSGRPISVSPTRSCCRSTAMSGATPSSVSGRCAKWCTSRRPALCSKSPSRDCNARPDTNPGWRCDFPASTDCAGTSRRARPTAWRTSNGCWRRSTAPAQQQRIVRHDKDHPMTMPTERPTTVESTTRPADCSYLNRFFGGPPLGVIFRLLLLSILVGVILEVLGLDPLNIFQSLRALAQRVWDMGFEAVRWLARYLALGAAVVLPIWLVVRLVRAPKGR